jgi:hypothetical protein
MGGVILRGAGLSATPVGQTILIVGSVAEFSAVMLLSILFAEGDSSILDHVLFFGIFAGVTAVVWFVLRRAEQQSSWPSPAGSGSRRSWVCGRHHPRRSPARRTGP